MQIPVARWVAPFGYPRINACSRLPMAFRSVPRPSSPPDAKASTECPYRARDHASELTDAHHAQKQSMQACSRTYAKHIHNLLSIFTIVFERITPRSRSRRTSLYTRIRSDWLTAARPKTHQNLIHTAKDHAGRQPSLRKAPAHDGQQTNTPAPRVADVCANRISSPWF